MVAESKGFIPPPALLKRVLRIIFEIAACPIQDEISSDLNIDVKLSLRALNAIYPERDDSAVVVKSILLRALYGGMACDIVMLSKYATQWVHRYQESFVDNDISNRIRGRLADSNSIQTTSNSLDQILWCEIPLLLHKKARQISDEKVMVLVLYGIDSLAMKDICLHGIDFHCSSILEDVVLANQDLYQKVVSIMPDIIGASKKSSEEWINVLSVLKEAMWEFSSGVNRRLAISGLQSQNSRKQTLEKVWLLTSDHFHRYSKNYVCARLVSM